MGNSRGGEFCIVLSLLFFFSAWCIVMFVLVFSYYCVVLVFLFCLGILRQLCQVSNGFKYNSFSLGIILQHSTHMRYA